jgi:RNA polymerase sigma factor (sigma-70 family)
MGNVLKLLRMFSPGIGAAGRFQTTSWSMVIAAAEQPAESAEAALAKLCQLYWYPVYAFARRRGNSEDDARDLTQAFFSRVLEKNYLKAADPARGRFRSFLLAAVRHFLANEWNREQAGKRGGGVLTIALDRETAEGRYCLEPATRETPEKVYERQWAQTLLDQVMASLREEYASGGRLDQFERLEPFLTATGGLPYTELARQWGNSEGAVKVAVHRIRKKYRMLLRQKIAETVASPAEIDDEIRFLLAALETSP